MILEKEMYCAIINFRNQGEYFDLDARGNSPDQARMLFDKENEDYPEIIESLVCIARIKIMEVNDG